ncbi:MAG: 8-oxo-dGTP diphosphatase [Eubacteriales bacterium]|nr:8-oxo-dGTP diphosphatase [Eubacteriales bacterium]
MKGPRLTTLCHLERNGCYLMLHRVKKEIDINKGKWIGVGGKFERGESPEDCVMREVFEETGFRLKGFCYRGLITFIYDTKDPEYIFVYSSTEFDTANAGAGSSKIDTAGDMPVPDCDEGIFAWVPKKDIMDLELWEGDRFMLSYLIRDRREPFSLKLCYDASDNLTEAWEMAAKPVRLK